MCKISSNQMVLVEETADLAQIKPLKLTSADGSSESQFDLHLTFTYCE